MIPVDSADLNGKPDRFLNLPKMESVDLKRLYTQAKNQEKHPQI